MRRRAGLGTAFLCALAVTLSACSPDPGEPAHVYLTWQGDATRTMTVQFHSRAEGAGRVHYDTAPRDGAPASYTWSAPSSRHRIPGVEDRWVHVVGLEGLEPGTVYHFIAGTGDGGFSPELRFRTLPGVPAPLRFIVGGDMKAGKRARRLLRHAAREDPSFAVIGGDLAYAEGAVENLPLWDRWLANWEQLMVTPDGILVPLILALGNHDTRDLEGTPRERAPFYFALFAQGGRSYFSVPLGPDAVLFLLDSGVLEPHGGEQAAWLEEQLGAHAGRRFKMAAYHHPLFPGRRAFDVPGAREGREHWMPLFDRFSLTVAFEHHDHVLKRTALLRAGRADPRGTLYLGDGAFGVGAKDLDGDAPWYLEHRASEPHFWAVEVGAEEVAYRAIGLRGDVLDTFAGRP